MKTITQTSAGGVAYRRRDATVDVALISVGEKQRWQLPKGLVDPGELPEMTALREVREEAGIDVQLIAPLDTIEYWYIGNERDGAGGKESRVRYHKRVHFYLMEYLAGNVDDHDAEVNEARWVEIEESSQLLAFKNERVVLAQAAALLRPPAAAAR